jgi:dUTP pyrophosphatase
LLLSTQGSLKDEPSPSKITIYSSIFASVNQHMKVKIINKSKHALPAYETTASAGMDLRANLEESITLSPLERAMVPTGLFIELPIGFEAQVRPRSGLAWKHGLSVLNSPGTIDADYRGEIKVVLVNLSNESFEIKDGERIAQMVVAAHSRVEWDAVDSLEETQRGAGGFGSTGK